MKKALLAEKAADDGERASRPAGTADGPRFASMANCAKVMFSSFLYFPPNQVNGVTDSTPGKPAGLLNSPAVRCRPGPLIVEQGDQPLFLCFTE